MFYFLQQCQDSGKGNLGGLIIVFNIAFNYLKKIFIWLHQVIVTALGIFSCDVCNLVA